MLSKTKLSFWLGSLGILSWLILPKIAQFPESTWNGAWPTQVCVFLIFTAFLDRILRIGARIRGAVPTLQVLDQSVFSRYFSDLGFGMLFLYFLAYLLTPVGVFKIQYSGFFWIIAWVIGPYDYEKNKFSRSKLDLTMLGVLFFLVALRLLESFQFHGHGDPYLVYLHAPRLWARESSFRDFLNYSQFFLTTSSESLYAWGSIALGLSDGRGLVPHQYFSQLCTAGLGYGGIALGLLALGVNHVRIAWVSIAAIAALQIPDLRWNANIAKNDFLVASMGLFSFFLIVQDITNAGLRFFSGLALGTAMIGKLPLVSLAVPMGIWVWKSLGFKKAITYSLFAFLGALPVFLRNGILTGNPVFPWFESIFHTGWVSGMFMEGTHQATRFQWNAANALTYLKELLLQGPYLVFSLMFLRKREVWIPFIAVLIFTLVFRPSTEIRYQNVNLILIVFFTVIFLFTPSPVFTRTLRWIGASVGLMILVQSNIPFFSLFQLGSKKYASIDTHLPEMICGAGKKALRQARISDQKGISIGDRYLYYVMDHGIRESFQDIQYGNLISEKGIEAGVREALGDPSYHWVYLCADHRSWGKSEEIQIMIQKLKADSKFSACEIGSGENWIILKTNCL